MVFLEPRVAISLFIALLIHFCVLLQVYTINVKNQERLLVLSDVELIDLLPPEAPPPLIKKEEPPKSFWEFSKKTLDSLKKLALPPEKVKEEPKELSKKLKETLPEKEEKLMDRQDPLKREKKTDLASLFDKGESKDLADIKISKETLDRKKAGSLLETPDEPALKIAEVGQRRVAVPKEKKPRNISELFGSKEAKEASNLSLADRRLARDLKAASQVRQVSSLFGGEEKESAIKLKREEGARAAEGRGKAAGGGLSQIFAKSGTGEGTGERIVLAKRASPTPSKEVEGKGRGGEGISDLFGQGKTPGGKGRGEGIKAVKKPSTESVQLTGPLAKRGKRETYLPLYPAWAEKEGIEADVSVHFTVSPAGGVIEAYVERTSGYKELDELALKAIRRWLFEPLPAEVVAENQWGIITFRFRLE